MRAAEDQSELSSEERLALRERVSREVISQYAEQLAELRAAAMAAQQEVRAAHAQTQTQALLEAEAAARADMRDRAEAIMREQEFFHADEIASLRAQIATCRPQSMS